MKKVIIVWDGKRKMKNIKKFINFWSKYSLANK